MEPPRATFLMSSLPRNEERVDRYGNFFGTINRTRALRVLRRRVVHLMPPIVPPPPHVPVRL